jgi:hypothetical protein
VLPQLQHLGGISAFAFHELCPFVPAASFAHCIFSTALAFHSSGSLTRLTITATIISDSALELGAMTGLFYDFLNDRRRWPGMGRKAQTTFLFLTNSNSQGKATAICTCTRQCIKLSISISTFVWAIRASIRNCCCFLSFSWTSFLEP